jgi:hypothetical protein
MSDNEYDIEGWYAEWWVWHCVHEVEHHQSRYDRLYWVTT